MGWPLGVIISSVQQMQTADFTQFTKHHKSLQACKSAQQIIRHVYLSTEPFKPQ